MNDTADKPRVFLVEDDPIVRRGSEQALALAEMAVTGFADAESALEAFDEQPPVVVVSDVRLPGRDGLQLLRELRQRDRELAVVLVTGHGDIAMAVEAMREGAYDFIEKPFASGRLVDVVGRAIERRALLQENRRLRERLADGSPAAARAARSHAPPRRRAAPTQRASR